jgi:hypothetical protein
MGRNADATEFSSGYSIEQRVPVFVRLVLSATKGVSVPGEGELEATAAGHQTGNVQRLLVNEGAVTAVETE